MILALPVLLSIDNLTTPLPPETHASPERPSQASPAPRWRSSGRVSAH
jgi:hypothetical protein